MVSFANQIQQTKVNFCKRTITIRKKEWRKKSDKTIGKILTRWTKSCAFSCLLSFVGIAAGGKSRQIDRIYCCCFFFFLPFVIILFVWLRFMAVKLGKVANICRFLFYYLVSYWGWFNWEHFGKLASQFGYLCLNAPRLMGCSISGCL